MASDGAFNYGYDNEGNLTTKTNIATGATTTYSYDYRNRLTTVVDKATNGNTTQTVEFAYDAFDRRISKTVNGQTTHLANDGDQLWAEYNEVGQVIARYLPGADVDEMIARYRPTDETSWYLTDRLGTIRDVVNQLGVLTNQIDYTSFGKLLTQTNPNASDRFAFTGREYDPETDLYYYRARYYDPALGRFTSQDPLGFGAQDLNLYRYVGNNPINATDPSGLIVAVEYSVINKKFTLGTGGAIPAAAIGFGQGFGATNLIFISQILRISNEGGDVLTEWGTAIERTEQEISNIITGLKIASLANDKTGIVGGFVDGANFQLDVRDRKVPLYSAAELEVEELSKAFPDELSSVKLPSNKVGINELPNSISITTEKGGFIEGYEEAIKRLRSLSCRVFG